MEDYNLIDKIIQNSTKNESEVSDSENVNSEVNESDCNISEDYNSENDSIKADDKISSQNDQNHDNEHEIESENDEDHDKDSRQTRNKKCTGSEIESENDEDCILIENIDANKNITECNCADKIVEKEIPFNILTTLSFSSISIPRSYYNSSIRKFEDFRKIQIETYKGTTRTLET